MTFSKLPPPISPVNASGVRIKTPEALKPAKWSLWSYKPYWGLWDACCLTFDFEPNQDGLHTWLTNKRLPNNFPADFADRLDILSSKFNMGESALSADLAAFALRCEWQIPDEMKALIKMPALVATSDDTDKRRAKKPSIETVALPYMREVYKAGQFASAAKFHRHLCTTAGKEQSPFEMGIGNNSRKLFCPDAGSFFDAGTLGKMWRKIRDM